MNKEQKINALEQKINHWENENKKCSEQINKEQIEQLKKENDFELPEYFESYTKYKDFIRPGINVCVMPKKLFDILSSKKQYATMKLQYIADQLNGDWKVDYEDGHQEAWTIFYAKSSKKFQTCPDYCKYVSKIYFKSEELAEKAIEITGPEMEYLKGVK